jgi:hypothetical protein
VAKSDKDPGFEWAYRDLLFNLVVAFLAIAACSILIKEPKPTSASPGGVLTIQMTWPLGSLSDVDLWVKEPDDPKPVGYTHRTGRSCDLVRDDLGASNDAASRALEQVVCRSSPEGEYIVNVHMYNYVEKDEHPMPVQVIVQQLASSDSGAESEVARATVRVTGPGQQITAVRFRLDSGGKLVPGSVNDLFRDIRSIGIAR